MKKRLLSVLLVMCMVFAMTGCAGKHTDKLVLALRAGTYSDVIKSCLADFEAENGITCEVLELSEDDLHSYILDDSVRMNGEYDLCMVDSSWVAEYIHEGVLTDLGELGYSFDDDIIPATTTICVRDGKTYLVPYYGNVTVMMYNRTVADEMGYTEDDIESIDDILELCTKSALNNNGGFVYRGDTENNIVVDFLPVLCAYGGWVVDENNNPTVDTPEFAAAMEMYLELAKTGGALAKNDLISSIEEGKMTVAVGWPGWYDTASVNSDYMAFPGKASDGSNSYNSNIYGIWTLGIPSNSTNKEMAAELLTYLMDKDVQKGTIKDGGVPCRYSCLNDPEEIAQDPHLPVICNALENGVYRPVMQEWPRFYSILGTEMMKIMAGQTDIEDGLSVAQAELEAMMKETK